MNNIESFTWKREDLFKGCLLASIAHAIMVAHYPDLLNEHSWSGKNYNVQDNMGIQGTITFENSYCIAAFRDDNSECLSGKNKIELANIYFKKLPKEFRKMAEMETLQYLLCDVNGIHKPVITTGFWGENEIYSLDTQKDFMENGGGILKTQLKDVKEGIRDWKEYYDMSSDQCNLLKDIYDRVITYGAETVTLSKNDIKRIACDDIESLEESKISFREIGIG